MGKKLQSYATLVINKYKVIRYTHTDFRLKWNPLDNRVVSSFRSRYKIEQPRENFVAGMRLSSLDKIKKLSSVVLY